MAAQGVILVVDDSESSRFILTTWLRRAGLEVIEGATGAEALAQVGSADVVILDVDLPDMSGFDVCAAIKLDPGTAVIPVLHTSATAVTTDDRAAGLNHGADGYLIEPLDREEFLATTRAMLRYSKQRRKAERLTERLYRLNQANLTIHGASSRRALFRTAAEEARTIFSAPAVVINRVDGDAFAAGVAGPAWAVTRAEAEDLAAVAGDIEVARVSPAAELRPGLGAVLGPESEDILLVPVSGRDGSALAMIAVGVAPGSPSDTDDILLGTQFAQLLALATENLRLLTEEHRIAITLQRSLLPLRLPEVTGLELAVSYTASGEHALVGGDFYDALEFPDGRVVVTIGDVQGHSIQAATIMAELRYSLRAYLAGDHDPTQAMAQLNALLMSGHPDSTATACMAVFSPDRSECQIVNAGHIPPLLLHDGVATFIEVPGTLLGLPAARPEPVTIAFPAGAVLLLVTDGLIEHRGTGLPEGLELLRETAVKARGGARPVCDLLVSDLAAEAVEDDVAVVAIGRPAEVT